LAIHVNYLAPNDAALLGESGASVVHCPRSHAYFGHQAFPRKKLSEAGVNLCVGTDSLATITASREQTIELDLRAELRTMADRHSGLTPEALLQLVTINAAKALRMSGQLGQLSEGALADLVAIPYSGPPRKAWEAVISHSGPVAAVMIDGQWVATSSWVAPTVATRS
jgi:cytosine/adenosine deaminase-related metal-dependent hydrolase